MSGICEQHDGEEVRFYCENCKDLACDDCIIGPHKNHKFVKLKEFGVRQKQALLKAVTSAEESKIPAIESSVTKAIENQTVFEDLIEEQVKTIKAKRKMVDDLFNQLQDDLIENFNSERTAAKKEFERFRKRQEKRIFDLRALIETVKEKKSDISDSDVAKCYVAFNKLLLHDPYADTTPNLQPPIYQFNDLFVSKEKLQPFLGHMESGAYSLADPVNTGKASKVNEEAEQIAISKLDEVFKESEQMPENETDNYVENVMWKRKDFTKLQSLSTDKEIAYIVLREMPLLIWLVGTHVTEVDFSGQEPTSKLLKQLDQDPNAAGLNSKNMLVLGFPNKKSLKQFQTSTSVVTRRVAYTLGSSNVYIGDQTIFCIGQMQHNVEELLLCLFDKSKGSSGRYILKWHSSGKQIQRELSLLPEKVDVSYPIQVCQNKNGLFCLVCRPENESWIVVIDQNGNQKFRYPPFDGKVNAFTGDSGSYDIVGAGFIGDSYITVTSRAKREQHLVDMNGQCVQTDRLPDSPIYSTTNFGEYVWMGFENGKVALFQCKEDNIYANIKI